MRVATLFAIAALCASATAAVVAVLDRSVDVDADDALPPTLRGQLLVAAPDMNDPTFAGTRVYLVHHDAAGAVGVVVNGPSLGAVYGVDIAWGGPVGQGGQNGHGAQVFVLHDGSNGFGANGGRGGGALVEDGVVVAGHDQHLMQALVHGRGPHHSRTFVGYAGWAPGQLEAELAAGAWSVVDVDGSVLFR